MEDLFSDKEILTDLFSDKEIQLTRTDSVVKKRVRHELCDGLDSPDVKRLKEDLFNDFGHDSVVQDLDLVMKSFEVELSTTTSTTNETQPDLGYLFEASDDELGLPPPPPPKEETELVRVVSDTSEVTEFCGFEEHDAVMGFGPFGAFDFGYEELFEYSDDLFSWRSEFLPGE